MALLYNPFNDFYAITCYEDSLSDSHSKASYDEFSQITKIANTTVTTTMTDTPANTTLALGP